MDWEVVKAEVLALLVEKGKKLAGKVQGDLDQYLKQVANWAVLALASGDKKLLASVRGQVKLLAQLEKIRAQESFFEALGEVLNIGIRVGLSLLAGYAGGTNP